MSENATPVIIQAETLERLLGADDVIVADLSNAAAYALEHIPGAVNVDGSLITAARPPVMGLLPDEDDLATALSEAGIRPDHHVIAYDSENNLKAARFLWTLDVIGHRRFSLLDGGLAAWIEAGLPTDAGEPDIEPSEYPVQYGDRHRADKDWIRARLGNPDLVVLDARTPAEYAGADARARRAGHIPGAVNIDWSTALRGGGDLRLRPLEELRALYAAAGVTPDREVVVHCQTHQRSSHTYLVLKALGYERIRGYPGSWSDWGNDPDAPIE